MSHELFRLSERVYNTPLLANRETIENISAFLEARNNGDMELAKKDDTESKSKLDKGEVGVALLEISGPLTYNLGFIEALCGGGALSSYESIDAAMDEVVADGSISTLAVTYDTGGGEARGSFATARRMREMADENGIHLVSFVEGGCNSAGYVLACTAHEVVMMDDNATSVGSIGALIALRNEIPKDKADGTEVLFISAGQDKVPFDDDGKFKKEFLEDLQERVDNLAVDFVSHVAEFRDMSEKSIRATKARTFQPEEALSLGLVDKVMGRESFFNYLADLRDGTEPPSPASVSKLESIGDSEKMSEENIVQLDELKAQMAEMSAVLEKQQASLELVTEQRDGLVKLEEARSKELLEGKLEGYSFASEGLMAVMAELGEESQGAILAAFDSAEATLAEATEGKAKAEEEKDADMFLQAGEEGEAELQSPAESLKASVSQIIKQKAQ